VNLGHGSGDNNSHGDSHHGALVAANVDLGHQGLDVNASIGGDHFGNPLSIDAGHDFGHHFHA
jgi:hypothetical protein